MAWFNRDKAGILTQVEDQIEVPEGHWTKCDGCSEPINRRELADSMLVCPKCGYHFRMGSIDYLRMLFDDSEFDLVDSNVSSVDALKFVDKKPYA
jgi:acetyl-CoA carboxylase carboxyl transferase subunit beta